MKRQKERARQEKQREKAERKRQRRLESKNRTPDSGLDDLQPDENSSPTPAPEHD